MKWVSHRMFSSFNFSGARHRFSPSANVGGRNRARFGRRRKRERREKKIYWGSSDFINNNEARGEESLSCREISRLRIMIDEKWLSRCGVEKANLSLSEQMFGLHARDVQQHRWHTKRAQEKRGQRDTKHNICFKTSPSVCANPPEDKWTFFHRCLSAPLSRPFFLHSIRHAHCLTCCSQDKEKHSRKDVKIDFPLWSYYQFKLI